MQIQNAIFDLDGTLIDSMPVWRKIQTDAIEENTGIKLTEAERKKCMQYPYFEVLDKLRDIITADCDRRYVYRQSMERMAKIYRDGSIPFKPMAKEYLIYLKEHGCGVGLSTATPKDLCVPYLKRTGIYDLFDCIFTEEELKVSKSTGPDVYDASLEFLGGTKENTAVFEDTLSCIRICKKNGYYTVAIAESLTPPEYLAEIKPLADRYIQSYKEMIH